MKMVNTPNWTDKEHEWLLDNIKRKSIEEIAAVLGRTPRAVRLYCYRHYIPVRPTVKKSMVQQLLDIKFGDWRYFRPTREFYERSNITQMRWNDLAWGYAQATEKELMDIARVLNFTNDEALVLMEARQGFLFDDNTLQEDGTNTAAHN